MHQMFSSGRIQCREKNKPRITACVFQAWLRRRTRFHALGGEAFSRTRKVKDMLNPTKADCIAILSAVSRLPDHATLDLDRQLPGLSRNGMKTAAAFLSERDCFKQHPDSNGHLEVDGLSLQGRLRLEQLAQG
jgi:hypothetical protein